MVEIYLNNEWVDITNQVLNQITSDRRADEVLDSGTFAFQSKTIDYNIAPLTHCRIDGVFWLCSSEANLIVPTEYWNHEVSLLEPTYMAHTVIIGSKAFSNRGAYKTHNDKIQILVELATSKNRLLFGYDADEYTIEPLIASKNIEREFTFGAGTSLFQMLLEIGKTVDAIPRIASFSIGVLGQTIYHITWDYLDSNTEYVLDNKRVLGIKYFQDVENYTAILETEMQNVVDRDTIVEVKNLTVRSEDFFISSDNQVLILPSKAEEIVKLEVNVPYNFTIYFNNIDPTYLNNITADYINDANRNVYYWKTLKNNSTFSIVANSIENALTQKGFYLFDDIPFQELVEDDGDITLYIVFVEGVLEPPLKPINMTKYLLEKAQWDLLDISVQPNYYYYTINGNIIHNMYEFYNSDLWNKLLKNDAVPPLIQYFKDMNFKVSTNYTDIQVGNYMAQNSKYNNPLNLSFNVSYRALIDTYINSSNNKKPFNESKIKPSSRSFEASTSIADFNLLVPSINKTNEMLGMPETTISYAGANYPSVGNLIKIKDQNYYVSSIQTTITKGNYISYINLVSSYSKIAEVFGVASQYESTRLPLTGIIDRFVYCGETSLNFIPTGMRVRFLNGNDQTQYVYKRGAYVSYGGTTYYVVSANDNYCFDTGLVENSELKSGNYENKQYLYADDNNEQMIYRIALAMEESDLTIDESRDLPNLPYNRYSEIDTMRSITTYKDAREHLIFTFKLL